MGKDKKVLRLEVRLTLLQQEKLDKITSFLDLNKTDVIVRLIDEAYFLLDNIELKK